MTAARGAQAVKCLVWDLDNTLWDGVLLEGDRVRVRPEALALLRTFDERGILQSLASRSEHDVAISKLRELGLHHYFVVPQVNWGAKSASVREIARRLNLGLDSIAFVDDDPFERDEVQASLPGVLVLDAADLASLPDLPALSPRVVTREARHRRGMVKADLARAAAEETMVPGEFLTSVGMVLTIADAEEGDLERIEELTTRTNQLNSTGYTYPHAELEAMRVSGLHRLLIASLDDRYGTYGKIGVAVVELGERHWLLRLLLMSCRVMSRGVGKVLLSHVLMEAARAGMPLRAEFIHTDSNRPMYLTLKLAGFAEVDRLDGAIVLEHDHAAIDPFPAHIRVLVTERSVRAAP